MPLKEYLLSLRSKLIQIQDNKLQNPREEVNYVNPSNDEELNDILINTINNFFPSTGRWGSNCFNRPNNILQSNLRNNKLLAKKILSAANLAPWYYNKVLEFINSSDLFKQKVYEYEQEIVKWQIDWMKNGGEHWICDEKLGGDLCLILPQCDIAFRKGVVDTLIAMGLNKDAIEEGLERNAKMWRNLFIERAFRVKYEPITLNLFGDKDFEPLPAADLEHKEAWIKMRKYEYYCDHKKSVDSYGSIDPEMLLTKEEIINLKIYLDEANAKRLALVEQRENAKLRRLIKN